MRYRSFTHGSVRRPAAVASSSVSSPAREAGTDANVTASVSCSSGSSHWTGDQLKTTSDVPSLPRVVETRPAAARSASYENV